MEMKTSISAVATTTVDVAGGLLAKAMQHQDDKYISTYDAGSKKLTISSAFDCSIYYSSYYRKVKYFNI